MLVSVTERTRGIGVRQALGWTTAVDATSILVAFLFATVAGILLGVWPARRAASPGPIDSLRHESRRALNLEGIRR